MRHHTAKRPQSVESEARKARMDELLEMARALRQQEMANRQEPERSKNGKAAQVNDR